MNESTLTQLKILVERAVRPVRACLHRKRRIREELLAHVTAVFEEESRQGDEAAALARTAERFGPPADLTPQLQAAIPAHDAFDRVTESLLGYGRRDSALLQATRHGLLVAAACTVGLVLVVVLTGTRHDWLSVERLPALLCPLTLGVVAFFFSLIARGLGGAFYTPGRRDWPRAIALGLAAWLVIPAVTVVACSLLTGGLVTSLRDVVPLLLPSLLAPVALLIAAMASLPSIRYHEEWASLPIG
jgi:hypothetical protein